MNLLKNTKLIKYLLILLIILLILLIIKEMQLINFFCTIFNLLSPLLIGFIIAWLVKPIMLFFSRYVNKYIATTITYLMIAVVIFVLGYFSFPVIIEEIKNLIPGAVKLYKGISPDILDKINFETYINKVVLFINDCSINIKNIALNMFYAFFISFFFLTNHEETSKYIRKYLPHKLIGEISLNLKAFVKGTLIDIVILFGMSLLGLTIVKMPYALLFSIIISITNVIPFIGPYIGGIPAIIVGLSVNFKTGIIITIVVVLLQFIESAFIHPLIMSKSLKLNPILILLGLIIFGYFFGILGMLISTPLISVLKTLYCYSKEHHLFKNLIPGK